MTHCQQLLEIISKNGLHNRHTWIAQIKTMIERGKLSESQAKSYLIIMEYLTKRNRNNLSLAPTFEEMYPGRMPDLIIGELQESKNVPAGFFLNDAMHIIFVGNSGSGKTTGMYNLALAVSEYNKKHPDDFICMIIWETTKGALLSIAQTIENCVVVSTSKTLRIGLQPPRGVPSDIWNNALGEIIAARGNLKAGAITIVEMLNFLSRAMNTPPSESGFLYPSFENLYELSNIAPKGLFESKEIYQQSANQVLRQLALGTDELYKAHCGGNIEDSIIAKRKHLLIDARGLSPEWVRAMTSDILLKRLLLGRQYRNEPNPRKCIIIWDEADEIVSRRAEENYSSMMPIIECERKGRNSNIGVSVGLNNLGTVSRTVLVDANYHFIGRIKDHEGLREAANTLVLPQGAYAILPALKPGEFLFRGPAWPDATLVKIFPNILPPVPENIHYDTLPFVPSCKLQEMPHVIQALQNEKASREAANLCIARTKKAGLSDKSKNFLSLACDMVGFPAASIFNRMGKIPFETQNSIRKELEAFNLIDFEIWRVEKSNRLFLEVKPAGFELVNKAFASLKGRGSPAHKSGMLYIQHTGIYKGYKHSESEFPIPGTTHAVDVAWYNEKFQDLCVFEVVHTCTDNLSKSIRTTFESGVPIKSLTIVSAQKNISKKIELIIKSDLTLFHYIGKINFELITPYLEAFLKGQSRDK